MKKLSTIYVTCILLLMSVAGFAQEYRATLTGRVTDPLGAVVPAAIITITNTATGASTVVRSGGTGDYYVPFLAPGPYSMTVVASGFEKFERGGLQLDTGTTVTVDVGLVVGSASETVTITAPSPLLDTATSDAGQVLTTQEAENLPSNGRSPLGFARDEYGVVPKLKHATSTVRPFDNSGASDVSMGGGLSQSNEIELNGVPNMEDSGRVSAFSPMMDAVDQVRVDEFSSDASMGQTSNGTIDITTKSGTNAFHGSLLEFYESPGWAGHQFFSPTASRTQQHQFGAAVGGPVWIPHVYDGHNKLFFFFAYEGFLTTQPGTTTTSVPTAAERTGDFSQLLTVNNSYQMYNPLAGVTSSGGTVTRQLIPNNQFANAGLTINPVAQAYLNYLPLPNNTGPTAKADGENNYIGNTPTHDDYGSSQGRMDYNLSQRDTLTGEIHRSNLVQTSFGVFPNIAEGSVAITNIWGGMIDNVYVFSPKLFLDVRGGGTRYFNKNTIPSQGFNATTLSFPSYMSSLSDFPAMPELLFKDGASPPTLSAKIGNIEKFTDYQVFTNLTKEWGQHTLKVGSDIRVNKYGNNSPNYAAGIFLFTSGNGNWMTLDSGAKNGTAAPFGDAFAEFLLGLPYGTSSSITNGDFDIDGSFLYNNWYFSGFAQDHWKVTHELSLDLGVRLEHELPITESDNRAVVRFNPTIANDTTANAEAAFTANLASYQKAGAVPANFSPTGGLVYATPSQRSNYNTQTLYASPRVGLAYAPDFLRGKTVFRAGAGMYYNPFNDYSGNFPQPYGYSQSTALVNSTNGMLSPATTLSDPFPTASNPILQPVGNLNGINTNLGQQVNFVNPNPKAPYSLRETFDIQHDFGRNMLLQVGYIHNHQVHLSMSVPLSYLPPNLLSQSPEKDTTEEGIYAASVPNPFYGLTLPGVTLPGIPSPVPLPGIGASKTVALSTLFGTYPEYLTSGFTTSAVSSPNAESLIPAESSNQNMLLARFSKRFSNGLAANVNYEYSRLLGTTNGPLNTGGPVWYGTNTSDFPQHLIVTAIYDLPFGRGKAIGRGANRLIDGLIGGWQVAGIYLLESGTALGNWPNVIYTGNWQDFQNTPHNYLHAFNTAVFNTTPAVQPDAYNFRTFPLLALRSDPSNNLDCSVLKNISVTEHASVQLRAEAYNALNRPQFSSPTLTPTSAAFGESTGTLNSPRALQVGARVIF